MVLWNERCLQTPKKCGRQRISGGEVFVDPFSPESDADVVRNAKGFILIEVLATPLFRIVFHKVLASTELIICTGPGH